MDEKTAIAYSLARAIAYTENGGKPDLKNPKKGKTGELASIYQFTPDTWKESAKKYLGDENAPLTADTETQVVVSRINNWLDKGYTAKQIASMWNAGSSEPDAHTGKFSTGRASKGVNKKYNVPYDVPAYASKVHKYAMDFYTNDFSKQIDQSPIVTRSQTANSTPQTITPAPTPSPTIDRPTASTSMRNNPIGGLLTSLAQKKM